jgi:sialidase-1
MATTKDGGMNWSAVSFNDDLFERGCQGSILRYTRGPAPAKDRPLFSNPTAKDKRKQLRVRLSYYEGATWPTGRLLLAGPAAYSCLTVLPDSTIGCLYERGRQSPYETIVFARFTLNWLSEGKDSRGPVK